MAKNLNSRSQPPWWSLLLQLGLPIVTQVVLEWVRVATGTTAPEMDDRRIEPLNEVQIPSPHEVP